jgi:methylmalonyl-CoA mutase cobalamin-binding subunit
MSLSLGPDLPEIRTAAVFGLARSGRAAVTALLERGVEVVGAHVTIGHHHDPVALARQLVRQARRPVVRA